MMKMYFPNLNISTGKIIPDIDIYEEYYTSDGIYKIKNNKIIKYVLSENKPTEKINNFINNYHCYISYDTYQQNSVHYHIPNDNFKVCIKRTKYKISDKLIYVIENNNEKQETYFLNNYLITDINLKELIATLII